MELFVYTKYRIILTSLFQELLMNLSVKKKQTLQGI